MPLFVIGNYSALDRPAINISYLPERKSGADNYALAVEQVAPFVDRWFGGHRPLPDLKAEVIDLPDADASPFESGSMLLMPLTGNDTTMLLSALRQLTHVAFPSSRPWISDGLALFAQVSYMEREKGRTAALAYLANHRNVLLESERTQAQGESSAAENSLVNSPDEFYVQAKAMNVWWMLRDLAGETEIIAALHNYNAADDKDAYYLQKLIEAQTHRDLGWFFDDWVYRDRGLPDFRIVSVYPRDLVSGGYMVTVTVENAGDAAAEVPVTLKMATGEASAKLVIEGKSSASIRIQAPAIPEEAIVNDGGVPERDTSNNTYRIGSGSENQ